MKSCDWHPQQCLVATGSQDNYVKLWDPRSGQDVFSMQPHNKIINRVRWNPINGNWLLTGSQDASLKVHDIRVMKEFNHFQGHDNQVTSVDWHPFKEELFASGSYTGQIIYWHANNGLLHLIDKAHFSPKGDPSMVWGLAWHPEGHMLVSTGNDHKLRFWG